MRCRQVISSADKKLSYAVRAMTSRGLVGEVAQSSLMHDYLIFRLSSANGLDLSPSEGREAVHAGDEDLDFGVLAVGISCYDPFAEKLQAIHPGLDAISDVIAGLNARPRCRVAHRMSSRAMTPRELRADGVALGSFARTVSGGDRTIVPDALLNVAGMKVPRVANRTSRRCRRRVTSSTPMTERPIQVSVACLPSGTMRSGRAPVADILCVG